MNSSLRNKLSIGVTLIEAVFLLFLALMVSSIVKDMLNENLSEKAKISANLFASMTKNAVLTFDIASLESFVAEIMQQEGVEYAVIRDAQGNILASQGALALINHNQPSTVTPELNLIDVISTQAKIEIDGQLFGTVKIGLSNANIEASVQEIQTVIAGIALAEIIFVSIVAFFFSGYLIKQLNTLKDSAENVTDQLKMGEPIAARIDISQTDKEIYTVAESFNSLINALNKQIHRSQTFQTELFDLNASLEEQVINRTAMLEESNQKLKHSNKHLKETQRQLSQAEKMASVGQLAAGVAHEINNPIGFVKSNLDTLNDYHRTFTKLFSLVDAYITCDDVSQRNILFDQIKQLSESEDILYLIGDSQDIITESSDGLKRVTDIVAGMKVFSRANDTSLQPFNINHCLETTLKMVANQLKYHCHITKQLAPDLPDIPINVGKMIQVFTNLLINAGQAIEENGSILIKTLQAEDYIEILIQDNGMGVPKENEDQIFNPFFTTKSEGEGTGLGLSITFNIVKEHGGTIHVETKEGVGTGFYIRLPIKQDETLDVNIEHSVKNITK